MLPLQRKRCMHICLAIWLQIAGWNGMWVLSHRIFRNGTNKSIIGPYRRSPLPFQCRFNPTSVSFNCSRTSEWQGNALAAKNRIIFHTMRCTDDRSLSETAWLSFINHPRRLLVYRPFEFAMKLIELSNLSWNRSRGIWTRLNSVQSIVICARWDNIARSTNTPKVVPDSIDKSRITRRPR